MDREEKIKRKANPRETANIFSFLSFSYTLELFVKGFRKGLHAGDVYEVLDNCRSEPLGDQLEKEWFLAKKTSSEQWAFYKALWICFGKTFVILGVLKLIVKTTITATQVWRARRPRQQTVVHASAAAAVSNMYHGDEAPRPINPKQRCNIISRTTFFYTLDLYKKGHIRSLKEDDVYRVIPNYGSKRVGDKLEAAYLEAKKRNKATVLWLFWRCYGKYYIFLGLVQFLMQIFMVMLQPLYLGKLVSYFTPKQDKVSYDQAVFYACVVIGLIVINSIYSHNYMMVMTEFSMKVRAAFSSLIYRKALKLNAASLSEITMGKIVTLITKDVNTFEGAILFTNDIWIGFVQIFVVAYMLYVRIGVASFSGIGFLIAVVPLQLLLGRLTSKIRLKASKNTDDRVQATQEVLSAIRIIKMYTWEKFFADKISKARRKEMKGIRRVFYTKMVNVVTGQLVTFISLYLLIMTYIWLGNYMTAEILFFTISCFQSLRSVISATIPIGLSLEAEMLASADRINKLLRAAELRESGRRISNYKKPLISLERAAVRIKDKVILKNINLRIDSGFNLLAGRVGCGKSSLLKTIMEDYEISEGHLEVHGSISYASEEPWVFPSSIKQNILFGQAYDAERYQKVLEVCALKFDISTFEKGDDTIVADRGLNLSKGQQARINLARTVYKDSDIYLLDDCLSSLDGHVQDYIFRECVKKFLKGKVCLMISSNPDHLKQADHVIILQDGTITNRVTPSEIPEEEINRIVALEEKNINGDVIDDMQLENEGETEKFLESTKLVDTEQQNQNVYHEINKEGQVDWKAYKKYYDFGGGIPLALSIFVIFLVCQFAVSYTQKLESSWSDIEQVLSDYKAKNMTHTHDYQEHLDKHHRLIKIHSIMIAVTVSLMLARAIAHFTFATRASVNLHNTMVRAITRATMDFFDSHYIGNILNRFSKDLGNVDELLPFIIYECMRLIGVLGGIVVLIATVNVRFFIPAGVVFVILCFIRYYYIPIGRSLKRLEAATRSPLIGHINSSLEGLTTIRACGAQEILEKEFDKHQDLYTSTFHMLQCTSRAFAFVLDLLCCAFVAVIIIFFIVVTTNTLAGDVGLAITQAFMLTGLLQWGIRQWAELESQMTSVERILEYTDIKEENNAGQIINDWPHSGKIVYENVSLTYAGSKNNVLKRIDVTIKPREKIGIVGRTGAGKSSIIATLFRLYNIEGRILIDDIDIKTVYLDYLRTSMTIIPQDPVLFTGSIRSNIDPTGRYSDEEIWKAIESVKLKYLIDTLDSDITESGSNFSSGQRQLICLARAIVSKNRIIVLDEATANMDPETDHLIYAAIQEHFSRCTVLTVAHRLHSVLNSDRVVVVDKGEIVEFASPNDLLRNKSGMFYQMVKRANLLIR